MRAPFAAAFVLFVVPLTASVPDVQAQLSAAPQAPATAPADRAATPAAGAAAAQPAATDAKATEDQKKAQRLAQIQQLSFDRRPSAILKAWVTPLEEPTPSSEKPPPAPAPPVPGSPEPTPAADDPFAKELKALQRDVTLGRWPEVKAFLAKLEKEEAKALYQRILVTLRDTTSGQLPPELPPEIAAQLTQQLAQLRQVQQQQPQMLEKPVLTLSDVIALAAACPGERDTAILASLGALLRIPLDQGHAVADLKALLREESTKPVEQAALDRRQAAKLLAAAGLEAEVSDFLPSVAEAEQAGDYEALNLLSRCFLALDRKEKQPKYTEQAWLVTQAVLASSDLKKEEKEQALARAVELAPKIKEELGQRWLEESFTNRPERGMEIIATIGAASAQALQVRPREAAFRLKGLELQNTAVEALLKAAPERASEWRTSLHLLAGNWLREAVYSYQNDQSNSGPRLQRDPFGNLFYFDEMQYLGQYRPQQQIEPIKTGELIEIRPSQAWLALIEASLRPKFDVLLANLYLKVNDEEKAFPFIERVAGKYPDLGHELVSDFLRLWTQNHDPNAARSRTNIYMYMYGFERKAESIPLTRSKQERNLKDLAALVPRLKAIAGDKIDQALLAKAFTTCHSSAEVYRLDAIEEVFGPIADLKPKMLAELVQQMRGNLAGLWRQPAVQEQAKTKRRQKDIEAEVMRGYQLARTVVEDALKKHTDDWSLVLALAALDHDENNYRREVKTDSKYSERRQAAFDRFQWAAELYAAKSADLPREEQSTQVFEIWFYAGLGACDLQHITEETIPDFKQPERIRAAIAALPASLVAHHQSLFANTLFTRMSGLNPAVKFRYLKGGFEIVGDHKQAHEARRVYDYYADLVTEVRLDVLVDGSDVVGHGEPFGVFVNLRHTRDIERESGGFGRYLQNQNNLYFSYNYGRPTANYREKFEEAARKALEEHFEVLSLTFQDQNVNSRATQDYGWRITPYVYMLLKARGPRVDKIPSLRLDLDFLDTSGYVVLPVESAAVPIDASPLVSPGRPHQKLAITQILDERQAGAGKLILEVKATAQGLVPRLDEILEVVPADFEVTGTDDQGVAVSRFDPDSEQNLIVSERLWSISLRAKDGLPDRPKSFRFARPTVDVHEVSYHRYVDADLVKVEEQVSLEQQYGSRGWAWLWLPGGIAAAGVLAAGLWWLAPRKKRRAATARFQVPEQVNAFTVLGLLQDIHRHDGLDEGARRELDTAIAGVERSYFADHEADAPNLRELAEAWVRRAR